MTEPTNKPKTPKPKPGPKLRDLRAAMTEATGPTPLDIITRAYRYHYKMFESELSKGKGCDHDVAMEHLGQAVDDASKAAPYIHPRLQSTEFRPGDLARMLTRLTDGELLELDRIFAKLGPSAAAERPDGGEAAPVREPAPTSH